MFNKMRLYNIAIKIYIPVNVNQFVHLLVDLKTDSEKKRAVKKFKCRKLIR